MKVALHGLTTALCPLAMDIRIARETGHDGLELVGPKLTRFLEAGHTFSDLRRLLDGFNIVIFPLNFSSIFSLAKHKKMSLM